MDQVNLPDPVKEDISLLQKSNTELTNRLLDMQDEIRQLHKELEKFYGTKEPEELPETAELPKTDE
jgi:predicted RNase H-like nuclease (RuvC/YqgF family)